MDSAVVRSDEACSLVAAAEQKMKLPRRRAAHLPVEPMRPFPVDALKDAVQHRAGSLNPYQMTATDFDLAFITPVLAYGAQIRRSRPTVPGAAAARARRISSRRWRARSWTSATGRGTSMIFHRCC